MAMEVHDAPKCDMDCFISECACLFHNKQLRAHLSLSVYIQFFKQHVSIAFQHVLTSIIKTNITLIGDACSRPPTTIRYHDLHDGDIRRLVGEIVPYNERD
jgi:hypothetical protein